MDTALDGMLITPSICEVTLMKNLPVAISTAGWQVLRESPSPLGELPYETGEDARPLAKG